jgi:hypothetical protein
MSRRSLRRALDNAAEGCGRELFGAALNRHQAQAAADPAVRAVMASIAPDEAAHAELSFALAGALTTRLSPAQRRRAQEAQAQVLESFLDDEVPGPAREALGLMDSARSADLAKALLSQRRI